MDVNLEAYLYGVGVLRKDVEESAAVDLRANVDLASYNFLQQVAD